MKYIELGINDFGIMIYGRIDDDGLMRVTCTQDNPDYQAWLNPKEPPTFPITTDTPTEQTQEGEE
jgi:hypothetical protein